MAGCLALQANKYDNSHKTDHKIKNMISKVKEVVKYGNLYHNFVITGKIPSVIYKLIMAWV